MRGLKVGAQRADRAQARRRRRAAGDHQPPERRAGLRRPADPAVAVPGRRARRQCNQPPQYTLPVPVHRPDQGRAAALRPGVARRRRGDDDHRRRASTVPFIVRQETRLPGPRPVQDPHALRPEEAVDALGAAEAVEPQGARHRAAAAAAAATAPAARRSTTSAARSPRSPAAPQLRRRARPRLRGDVDGARQHRPQLQRRARGRGADHAQGAGDRALRRHPLHDRHRLLGRLDRPADGRQRLPRCGLRRAGRHLRLPGHADAPARSSPTTTCCARTSRTRRVGRRLWTPAQWAAVEGRPDPVNAIVADEGLFKDATNPVGDCVPAEQAYDPQTNPGGVRCSILDYMINMLRPAPEERLVARRRRRPGTASPASRSATPASSTACSALQQGLITPEQFVDLNEKIGGLRHRRSTRRRSGCAGDDRAVANAYRTGMINEATTSTASRSSTTPAPTRASRTTTRTPGGSATA